MSPCLQYDGTLKSDQWMKMPGGEEGGASFEGAVSGKAAKVERSVEQKGEVMGCVRVRCGLALSRRIKRQPSRLARLRREAGKRANRLFLT